MELMFAHLGFHRCHDRLQPVFHILVCDRVHMHHPVRQGFEKFRGDGKFFVGQHVEHGVEVLVVGFFQSGDLP